jgi:hypothetical protein
LGALAHYIFGHVDATSAISNDKDFMKKMLSLDANADVAVTNGTRDDRYATWSKLNDISSNNVLSWNDSTTSDANLAVRLVKGIVMKGYDSSGNIIVSDVSGVQQETEVNYSLARIVAQVIKQDISRLTRHDNSGGTKNVRQLLKFITGDRIHMTIKVQKPEINVSNNNVSSETLKSFYPGQVISYNLKIVLKEEEQGL